MHPDPNGSPSEEGEEGGISNLLALATVSEVYLMNNSRDEDRGVAVAARSLRDINNNSNATSGDIPARTTVLSATESGPPEEGFTSNPLPLVEECAADVVDIATARANDLQGNSSLPAVYFAPKEDSVSGARSQTNITQPQKTSATSKKRSHQRVQLIQQQQRGSDVIKKKNKPSFPVILMAIMSGSQNREYITFLSDEQRFIIIDSVSLETRVLPLHFEVNVPTYDQFLQLLDLWGFEVLKDPNYPFVKVFKHPMFRKGDWEGCLQIQLPDASNQMQAFKKSQVATALRRKGNVLSLSLSSIPSVTTEEAKTRPVTPPKASSSSELFEQIMAPAQTEMGMLLTSLPTKNFMYRRVTYDHTPGEATAAFQQKLRECLVLQRNQGTMRDVERQIMDHSKSMPMIHRRASLNDMDVRAAERVQLNGNVCLPMNYRRPSLDDTWDMSPTHNINTQVHKSSRDQNRIPSSMPPTDAEVRSATQDIVSAAIDALCPKRQRLTVDCLPRSGSSVCLDIMTEIFLQRSRRVLSSRPVSIMGPRSTTMRGNIDSTTTKNNSNNNSA